MREVLKNFLTNYGKSVKINFAARALRAAKPAALAHLVERHLAKVEVASSSLVIRSMKIWRCSFNCGAKVLWCRSQAVRQRSAKPLCTSSNLVGTSNAKAPDEIVRRFSYFFERTGEYKAGE